MTFDPGPGGWRGFRRTAALLTALLSLSAVSGIAQAPPPGVLVAKASLRELQRETDYIGRVQAIDKVEIRARVTGFLISRDYLEGRDVRKGDLLFAIDPAPFQAELDGKRAALAGAEAAALNAEQELARARELASRDFGTRQRLDQRLAEEAKARADVLAARAAVTTAEINLGYTQIRSPIDGRAGPATFTVGNLVGPDSGALATIVGQDPIQVTITLTQREWLAIRQKATSDKLTIRLRLVDGSIYPHLGSIAFADVQFSQQTDSLAIRLRFANPDRLLVEGQSVRVNVLTEVQQRFVTVPQEAIQTDQSGPFVLTVDGDNKVVPRRIQTGLGRGGIIAVTQGLREGERVIVQGIQKVRPGMVVSASEMPSADGASR